MNTVQHDKLRIVIRNQLIGMSYANQSFNTALRALSFAESVHTGTRKDGVTKEFNHQLNICGFFLSLVPQMRVGSNDPLLTDGIIKNTLVTILLHDTIEDYPEHTDSVLSNFHDEYVYIAKMSKTGMTTEAYYAQVSTTVPTVVAKAIDRIHNLSTMRGVMSEQKITDYTKETQDYVLPMLKTARNNFPEYTLIFELLKSVLNIEIGCLVGHK